MRLLIVILFPFVLHAQDKLNERGTYVISVITKGGIVVGSDSRACLLDDTDVHKPIYSYSDGVQKIFNYRKVMFQFAGQYTYSYFTIWGLFMKFEKENKIQVTARNFFYVFRNFAKNNLSGEDFIQFNANTIYVVSGYVKFIPCIYVYSKNYEDSTIGGGYITNDPIDNRNPIFVHDMDTITFNSAMTYIRRLIIEKSKQKNNQVSDIGGSPSIGYIKSNGSVFSDFQNKYSFANQKDQLIANFYDKIPRWYKSKIDSIKYKNTIIKILKNTFNTIL